MSPDAMPGGLTGKAEGTPTKKPQRNLRFAEDAKIQIPTAISCRQVAAIYRDIAASSLWMPLIS